ncbi:MAG: alpha-amylase family glycosyl hydrolase [Bacteroidetes bacterium]|jgi:glycosidase|nr:alpha-amylase family glycosyl hydrolase [Bacteroidota bacterium]
MSKLSLLLLLLMTGIILPIQAQVITSDPTFPTANDAVTITFYANEGSGGLAGYTGDVYAHSGVITNNSSSSSDWKYVISDWGENIPKAKLTRTAPDTYTLSITPDVRSFYGVPANETIEKMAFVFRSATAVNGSYLEGKTAENGDIFYDIYAGGLFVNFISPSEPQVLIEEDESLDIEVSSAGADSLKLYINDNLISQTSSATINYTIAAGSSGTNTVKAIALTSTEMVADSFMYFVRPEVPIASLPENVIEGINYRNDSTAVLALYAPYKEYVFVIGDFNNWDLSIESYMNRTPDQSYYWIELSSLEPGREYAYQYFVDGNLRIADPYTEKVLDPWNDSYIPSSIYPNLMPYPEGKTSGIVSVLQTAKPEYQWEIADFEAPDPETLVIYELHIRDFVGTRAIKTVMDTLDYLERLGVNAIELMPINEFEGNDSWGYNPSFYFASDKAYGTENDYKMFIDECHKRGIAVLIDMVLNHSYGQSPLVQLYFDPTAGEYGQPTAQNPWYNQVCPHQPYCWGYDFDHESAQTKKFVDRVNRFWIENYKVDGFRFDFTKGFSNVVGDGGPYNSQRIAILKRMADEIRETNPDTYIILEHFADNTEEKELSAYGMMLWGNLNHNYNEATMGYLPQSNFSGISYKQRGWNQPHLVGYMESHDEERQMYKNITYGNQDNPYHDTRKLNVAAKRNAAAAAMFLLVPGPKMIWQFGELGYDVSIDYDCRVCPKPIRWNYLDNWDRRLLLNYYSELIALKKSHAVFNTNDFTLNASGAGKTLRLFDEDMSVIVVSNFDVNGIDTQPGFYETGLWYDYFNNDSINVTDENMSIWLEAGEFKVYTTKKLQTPEFVDLSEVSPANNQQLDFFPNPSDGNFTFSILVTEPSLVSIELYNLAGQLLSKTASRKLLPGRQTIQFNALENQPNGIYISKVNINNSQYISKLIKK